MRDPFLINSLPLQSKNEQQMKTVKNVLMDLQLANVCGPCLSVQGESF